ncbi:hypothetical protein AOT82_269 [Psychrobacter sp. AntiMn-1]|nr:hypothetical protein AOT82_269 [Psychrobacter sp. AntiMn-1]
MSRFFLNMSLLNDSLFDLTPQGLSTGYNTRMAWHGGACV